MSAARLRLIVGLLLLGLAFYAGNRFAQRDAPGSKPTKPVAETTTPDRLDPVGYQTGGAWIATISEADARGEVRAIYQSVASGVPVDNMVRIHSLDPRLMKAHLELQEILFHEHDTTLPPADRHLVAIAVSETNRCYYCQVQHTAPIFGADERLPSANQIATLTRGRNSREAALIAFSRKLTDSHAEMTRSDVESLRNVGYSDTDILQITEIVGYMNFVNRIALGLGVPLESRWRGDLPLTR